MVGVCMEPLMLIIIMMGGRGWRTIHPCWVRGVVELPIYNMLPCIIFLKVAEVA